MSAEDRDARFAEFVRANPHLVRRLEQLALEAKRKGVKVGIRLLWERCRWDVLMAVEHVEGDYKLNDHFTAPMARLLNQRVGLEGFFDIRDREETSEPYREPRQDELFGGVA